MIRCLYCDNPIDDNKQFCNNDCRDAMGVRACPFIVEEQQRRQPLYYVIPVYPTVEPEPISEVGYIYVLKCNEFYKIGIADDIKKRMASLQTGNPVKLKLILSQRHAMYKDSEKFYHQYFRDKRIQGEWFKLTDEDVEWLAGMFVKFMINNPRI